jgi:hypothetical protein
MGNFPIPIDLYYQDKLKNLLNGDLGKKYKNTESLYNNFQELLDGEGTDTVSVANLNDTLKDLGLIDDKGEVAVKDPSKISVELEDKYQFEYDGGKWTHTSGTDGFKDSVVVKVNGTEHDLNVDVTSLTKAVNEKYAEYKQKAEYVKQAYNAVNQGKNAAEQIATQAKDTLANQLSKAAEILNKAEQYRQDYTNALNDLKKNFELKPKSDSYEDVKSAVKDKLKDLINEYKKAKTKAEKKKKLADIKKLLKYFLNLKKAYYEFQKNVVEQFQTLQKELEEAENNLPSTNYLNINWSDYIGEDPNKKKILKEDKLNENFPKTVYNGLTDAGVAAAKTVYEIGKLILQTVNSKLGNLENYYYQSKKDDNITNISNQLNQMAEKVEKATISPDKITDYLNDDGSLKDDKVEALLGISSSTAIKSDDIDFSKIKTGIKPDYLNGLKALITVINNEYNNIEKPEENPVEGIGDKLYKWQLLYNDVNTLFNQLKDKQPEVSNMYNKVAEQYKTAEELYQKVVNDTEYVYSAETKTIIDQLGNIKNALNNLKNALQEEEQTVDNLDDIDLDSLSDEDIENIDETDSKADTYEEQANQLYTNLLSLKSQLENEINNYSSKIVNDTSDPYQKAYNYYYQSLVNALDFTYKLIDIIGQKLDTDNNGKLDTDIDLNKDNKYDANDIQKLINEVDNIISQLQAKDKFHSWDSNNNKEIEASEVDVDGDGKADAS